MFELLGSEDGQTAVEYGAVLALAVVVVLVLVAADGAIASFVSDALSGISSAL
jgi:Flp pilus assembly pilin Flp